MPGFSHPDWVFGLEFSPDGKHLVTACRDRAARIWDWRNERLVLPPFKHDAEVHDVSFSPDGRFVVTCGHDYQVHLWSAADGKPVVPPQSLSGRGWMIKWIDNSAVISGTGPALTVLNLDRLENWADRSVSDFVLFSELVSGRRIEAGGETLLTSEEWLDRYQKARAALPEEFVLDFETTADSSPELEQASEKRFRDVLIKKLGFRRAGKD